MIHGDEIDEGGDDPNPSSCGGGGEDLGDALDEALEVGGWVCDGEESGEGYLFWWREVKEEKD